MKTSDSKHEQKASISSDSSQESLHKNNNTSSGNKNEDSSKEELRLVDEKNMVGQPMGNHIQNTNFKHQTPTDETNKQNFSKGDSNMMKEKLQTETPEIDVIKSLKNKSDKRNIK